MVSASSLLARDELNAVGRPATAEAPLGDDGQLIVALRDGTETLDVDRVLRAGGARSVRPSRASRRFLVRLEPDTTVERALVEYSRMPGVLYAERNGRVRKSDGATLQPNDRFYRYQWNLKQVDAERAWGIQKGSRSVAVAVIDTGVAYEDYTDPRTGQTFRKAPDWGDTLFLPGYDFVNNDTHPDDDEFHGTHVASVIAEATDNAVGVAGLAFGCSIMPIKVLDADGEGTFFDVAEGIDYAVNYRENGKNPVKVINISLGGEENNQTVAAAVMRAASAGILVVAAAGNHTNAIQYPAALPNVMAVGALDARKQRAVYSNTGSELDIMAPGGDCARDDDGDGWEDCIWQQMPDPEAIASGRHDVFCYCGISGTSMAAPHVAAAAALLFSQGYTDDDAVRGVLEQTAERLGGAPVNGRNDSYGSGLVQPAVALPGMGPNLGPRKQP